MPSPAPGTLAVLTPSLNYARYLVDALDSVEAQKGVDVVHVVQDGGSTDGTLELLRSRAGVMWHAGSDEGQSDALNRALSRTDASWIAWLNADEFYLPEALSTLLRGAVDSNADVVYGDAVIVDDEAHLLKLLPQHPFASVILRGYGPFPSTCAALFRREALGAAPWRTELRTVMDWDLYLKLLKEGRRFHYIPRLVGAFRWHSEQISDRLRDQVADERIAVRDRYGIRHWGTTRLGHDLHRAYKLVSGSYRRQLRARRFAGTDLRWFVDPGRRDPVTKFVEDVYGR